MLVCVVSTACKAVKMPRKADRTDAAITCRGHGNSTSVMISNGRSPKFRTPRKGRLGADLSRQALGRAEPSVVYRTRMVPPAHSTDPPSLEPHPMSPCLCSKSMTLMRPPLRARPAARAERMANSRLRPTARTKSRLASVAQREQQPIGHRSPPREDSLVASGQRGRSRLSC